MWVYIWLELYVVLEKVIDILKFDLVIIFFEDV